MPIQLKSPRILAVALLVTALILSLLVPPAPAAASASTSSGRVPFIEGNFADPEIVFDPASGQFWTYSTGTTVWGDRFNVPVQSTQDLGTAPHPRGDALPALPSWASPDHTWAPGVARIGSTWNLYFTARHTASGRQCVGVATSSVPSGPFQARGNAPIVCQLDLGGTIDASPFQDPATGKHYLTFKSDENAPGAPGTPRLWSQELTGDGLGLVGARRVLLTYQRGAEDPLIENPDMVHANGRYWLFYSANWWNSDRYFTHVASCSGPLGPCTRLGDPYQPWLGNGSGVIGPGGAALVAGPTGSHHIAYHGWVGAVGSGFRSMFVDLVTFDGTNGAPRRHAASQTRPLTVVPIELDQSYARFITAAHETFLKRPPTAAELHWHGTRHATGADPDEMIVGLATSREWIGVEIDVLYQRAFGRNADPGGREHWRSYVLGGRHLSDVGVQLYASAEFWKRSGSTPTEFVTGLYRNILGREPDPGGLEFWTAWVLWGVPRAEIANRFYDSIESRTGRVQGLYRSILGRNADPGGLKHWSALLLHVDDVRLAQHLALSGEYYRRSQR